MPIAINDEKKIDVLVSALEERYKSLHTIRERVQNICVLALGVLLSAGGWLIQSDVQLTTQQKGLFLIGLGVAFLVLRFGYLRDLHRGFRIQQQTAVRLETALGMYTAGMFDDSKESLYPESWKNAGAKNSGGKFEDTTYWLLYVGVMFLAITIVLNGCWRVE